METQDIRFWATSTASFRETLLKSNNRSLNEAIDVAQNRSLWRLMSMLHSSSSASHKRQKERDVTIVAMYYANRSHDISQTQTYIRKISSCISFRQKLFPPFTSNTVPVSLIWAVRASVIRSQRSNDINVTKRVFVRIARYNVYITHWRRMIL